MDQEVDGSGKVLDGYQNKGCKAYFLPLDNGTYNFDWTSNYQVLTAVHLKPKPSLFTKTNTFTLPAGDRKTVIQAFKKAIM